MADVSKLSESTKAEIIAFLENALADVEAEDHKPIDCTYVPQEDEEPDASAYSNADKVIAELIKRGHGDYTAHRRAIAQLWDGPYGLWQGNDDCTTDLEDPNLKDLWLIQEDHYDQHMTKADGKPKWKDMLCSAGDYIFFA